MTCRTCKFWTNMGSYCRRHAPKMHIEKIKGNLSIGISDHYENKTIWPVMHTDDWCGDYEEQNDPETPQQN